MNHSNILKIFDVWVNKQGQDNRHSSSLWSSVFSQPSVNEVILVYGRTRGGGRANGQYCVLPGVCMRSVRRLPYTPGATQRVPRDKHRYLCAYDDAPADRLALYDISCSAWPAPTCHLLLRPALINDWPAMMVMLLKAPLGLSIIRARKFLAIFYPYHPFSL